MKSLSSPSVILWIEESVLVCIYWSWWLLFFAVWRNTVLVVKIHSQIVRRFRNRKSIAMKHRPNCWRYSWIHKCWFFLHGHNILNRRYHTEITVSTAIARHPPNHEHSKQHTTSFSIHPRIQFGWTRSAAHVWCPFFCPGPLPYSRNTKKNMPFLIVGVIENFLEANVIAPQI